MNFVLLLFIIYRSLCKSVLCLNNALYYFHKRSDESMLLTPLSFESRLVANMILNIFLLLLFLVVFVILFRKLVRKFFQLNPEQGRRARRWEMKEKKRGMTEKNENWVQVGGGLVLITVASLRMVCFSVRMEKNITCCSYYEFTLLK